MEVLLRHPSLQNTINVFYFAVNTSRTNTPSTKLRRNDFKREEPENFEGHKFRVVALPYFPVSRMKRGAEEKGTTVTLLDSVDFRMLESFASISNFTYVVHEPADGEWGKELVNGNWTGIPGNLQHYLADFSLNIAPTPTRTRIMEISTIYVQDNVVIFSPKASLLPQHLAIIKPFTGELWVALSVSILVWSITLWLMQRAWSKISEGRGVEFSSAFFYGWGALIENWTPKVPINITGRMLVLVWLMACMIVTTAYRSSLVAHLTVQEKNPEVDALSDLLNRDGWGWGVSFSGGALYASFKNNPDAAIQKIFKQMQASFEGHFLACCKKNGNSSALPVETL
ncbi:probable glutamate receptor [Panulirus ornatus]|uniref:probable glutamate receptor n=1 Tax=Panulirus ornatus TaxID=150431 RepID=UPI003A8B4B82